MDKLGLYEIPMLRQQIVVAMQARVAERRAGLIGKIDDLIACPTPPLKEGSDELQRSRVHLGAIGFDCGAMHSGCFPSIKSQTRPLNLLGCPIPLSRQIIANTPYNQNCKNGAKDHT